MKRIVEKLTKEGKTISTMESCTGGLLASTITDIEGASEVLKFSAVTYSNEYKIKMGVDAEVIKKYSVYSVNTAMEMSRSISNFADSTYGVGITGKLGRIDKDNLQGDDNTVFISIYDKDNDKYYTYDLEVRENSREKNKKIVVDFIIDKVLKLK